MEDQLEKLYDRRFSGEELHQKNQIWAVLCKCFFQRFIPREATVLDLGAGSCEFINNIDCARKYAVDINKHAGRFANEDVTLVSCPATDLACLAEGSIDIVFMSNFLEHLANKDDVLSTLAEIFRVLRVHGRIMVLQPNIRFLSREYWDFFDHHIPLSDKSLVEALELAGFTIERVIPRFLPYTTKSRLPRRPFWVGLYLTIPFAWRLIGKQAFILGRKYVQGH
jgi:ubiquinone/menaquinone biosynthesis C-methylase UbiE